MRTLPVLAVLAVLVVAPVVVSCATTTDAVSPEAPSMHPATMRHRFEHAEQWARVFDDPARDAWQKPDAIVALFAGRGAVADIGAGTGYFSVRLAKAGHAVYAVDVEDDMVHYLAERARKEGLDKLVAVRGERDDPKLPAPVDGVLIVDTVHHIENRTAYFAKLAPSLAPNAIVVVVDFKLGQIPVGPPEKARVTPDALAHELAGAGYEQVSVDESTLPYQYIATFRMRASS